MANQVTAMLTPEQVNRCIMLTWRAHNRARKMLGDDLAIPIAIIGGTGVGKTSSVKAFHTKIDSHFQKKGKSVRWCKLMLSLYEAPDVGGYAIPNVKEGKAEHLMQSHIPFDTEDHAIVFADEFDRAQPDVQNAYLQILLGGDFHGHRLSPNAYNILAMNGTSDIYTTPLCEAAKTRVCSVFVGGRNEDSIESYDNWAQSKGMSDFIRTFNRYIPLNRPDPVYEELASDTQRTRDMASIVSMERAAVDDAESFRTDDIYMPVIAGLIGMTAAAQYLEMEKIIKKGGVMPEDIFTSPAEAEVPDHIHYIYFLLEACLGQLNADKTKAVKRAERMIIYAKRLRMEWQLTWRYRIGKAVPTVCASNAYLSWNPR